MTPRETKKPGATEAEKKVKGSKRSFVKEFIKSPGSVGALSPSGPYLAREMVKRSAIDRAGVVVEYGPGTGAFTGAIVSNLRPGATFFAIELSETLSELFRERHPGVKLHTASVSEVSRLLELEGHEGRESVDVIFSGLPWSVFSAELQHELLRATVGALKPGGELLTFAYSGLSALSPAGRAFRKILPTYFSKVEYGRSVLRNIPPAFVFRCVK